MTNLIRGIQLVALNLVSAVGTCKIEDEISHPTKEATRSLEVIARRFHPFGSWGPRDLSSKVEGVSHDNSRAR